MADNIKTGTGTHPLLRMKPKRHSLQVVGRMPTVTGAGNDLVDMSNLPGLVDGFCQAI